METAITLLAPDIGILGRYPHLKAAFAKPKIQTGTAYQEIGTVIEFGIGILIIIQDGAYTDFSLVQELKIGRKFLRKEGPYRYQQQGQHQQAKGGLLWCCHNMGLLIDSQFDAVAAGGGFFHNLPAKAPDSLQSGVIGF